MSSPSGVATVSIRRSPRSIRTVFAGPARRIRASSSSPGGGRCAALGGAGSCGEVVAASRSGAGRRAAARVEIASRTIITITNRRAATAIA
jgi:hypothetical protein